jgi:hypothetical protein
VKRDRGNAGFTEVDMNANDLEIPGIGLLRYEAEYSWYAVKIDVAQLVVEIRLALDEDEAIDGALARCRNLVAKIVAYAEKANQFAAEHLLELKNTIWLDDDEAPLTSDQFQDRIILESITISPDGELDFFHNDGDMFWGHSVLVSIDQDDRFIEANIAG